MTTFATDERLRPTLYGYQIFFILLTAVIGHGIFGTNGEALSVAGPWGLILAILVMSVVTICVGECVGELTQQFPIYSAIVAYVQAFVDEDLGFVIGLAYWYSYAAAFATQNATAATLSQFWEPKQVPWQPIAFYIAGPIVMFGLNMTGVFVYGVVETISGILKMVFIAAISIYMYVIAGEGRTGKPPHPISEGFAHGSDPQVWGTVGQAVCYAIPIVAYSFQGIEICAMAACEARDAQALRWPSRWTVYVVALIYILCSLGEALTVHWTDGDLPGKPRDQRPTDRPLMSSMIIIAAWNAGHKRFAGFLNGVLIFSVLSAANTSLYASSRTLYGLSQRSKTRNWITRRLEPLGVLTKQTKIPARALVFSMLLFIWVPFLQLAQRDDIRSVMAFSTSTSCMIVWAAICLAYLRYYYWLKRCDKGLLQNYPELRRASEKYKAGVNLENLQPLPAWVGLIGCILVFGFSSATWWKQQADFAMVAKAYAAHVVLLVVFIFMKLVNKRLFRPWGVNLTSDADYLASEVIKPLRFAKIEKRPSDALRKFRRLLPFKGGAKGSCATPNHETGDIPAINMNGYALERRSRVRSSSV